MSFAVQTLYSDPGHAAYGFESFVLARLEHVPKAEDFERMRHAYRAIVADQGRLTSITVLDCELGLNFDEETRRASKETTLEFVDVNEGSAVVIPVEGIRGSVYRAIISSIQLTARNHKPQDVFKAWEPAVRWLLALDTQPEPLRGNGDAMVEALLQKIPPSDAGGE